MSNNILLPKYLYLNLDDLGFLIMGPRFWSRLTELVLSMVGLRFTIILTTMLLKFHGFAIRSGKIFMSDLQT